MPHPTHPHRLPPPLPLPAPGIEGLEILDELPGAAGLLLMASLRGVTLWARVAQSERAGLYLEGAQQKRLREMGDAALPAEISGPLTLLASLLDAPEDADAPEVARACRWLSEWAEDHGHFATSYLFLHAAALAEPESPALALQVGRAASAQRDPATAESWLQHALVLSRGREDRDGCALAWLALADLHLLRGDAHSAHRAARRALGASRRKHRGGIPHHAPAGSSALPLLAHDLAYLWITEGHHRSALRVFEAMRPLLLSRSLDWLYLMANTARAAAGCALPHAYSEARAECLEMCRLLGEPPGAAAALLEVALAAASLGDAEDARSLAMHASRLASRHGEQEIGVQAAALLAGPGRVVGAPCGAGSAVPEVEALSHELSRALERCAPLCRC
jgi:hypothetical protein